MGGLYSLVTVASTLCANISFEKHPKIRRREDSRTGRGWSLSSRWGYALEVCSRWLKEILDNVGKVRGLDRDSSYREKTRQGNEIDWEMSVNPKSIELGPIK